ncbi:hypothetical protein ES708_23529 [subsurface metagenome]
MRSVHIRIRHDNDFVVTQPLQIEGTSRAGTESRNDRQQLVVGQNFVDSGFFNIEHLSPKRKDRLKLTVPAKFGASTGGIPLHKIQFALCRILLGAIGQLSWKSA